MTSLATRQGAKKFNQTLSFDISGVTSMRSMFSVRALAPTSSRALLCMRLAPHDQHRAHRPLASQPAPHPTS